jgi:hypothetical protein
MQSHLSNPWNNAASFVALFSGAQQILTGSGFFWIQDSKKYLITNWHVVAGLNPVTNRPLSRRGLVPTHMTFMAFKRLTEPDGQGFFELRWLPIEISLRNNEHSAARCYEHASFGSRVDVVAIDVTDVVQGFQIEHANVLESDAKLDPIAAQDMFVLGFPFGLMAGAPAPIWKRASVALDPSFDVGGLPKMLVDTATREGMSGSVALARHIVVGTDYPRKDGSRSPPTLYARLDTVAGVYSGRNFPDLERAQLGVIWKRRVIEEVVQSGRLVNR